MKSLGLILVCWAFRALNYECLGIPEVWSRIFPPLWILQKSMKCPPKSNFPWGSKRRSDHYMCLDVPRWFCERSWSSLIFSTLTPSENLSANLVKLCTLYLGHHNRSFDGQTLYDHGQLWSESDFLLRTHLVVNTAVKTANFLMALKATCPSGPNWNFGRDGAAQKMTAGIEFAA